MSGIKNLIQQNTKGMKVPTNEEVKAIAKGKPQPYRPNIDKEKGKK